MNQDLVEDDEFYDEDDEDTLLDKYLIFECDQKLYALEIRYVTEIVAAQPITEVPDLPPSIKGIINLRGKVFPVLDVRIRFNLPSVEFTERTCFIIASMDDSTIGLIVDAVKEVEIISPDQIEHPPKMGDALNSRFVKGIGKSQNNVKIILELKNLLKEGNLQKLESSVHEGSI